MTPETHVDHASLRSALLMLKEVTKKVNETRRIAENLEKVSKVQRTLIENTGGDDVPVCI